METFIIATYHIWKQRNNFIYLTEAGLLSPLGKTSSEERPNLKLLDVG